MSLAKRKRPRIAVIDDDRSCLEVMSAVLSSMGEVVIYSSGVEGLKSVIADPPDVILLDVNIPDMDGFSICEKIKNNHNTRNLPIIFVTGEGDLIFEQRAFKAGAVDFLQKPLSLVRVKLRVKAHLALKRLTDRFEEMSQTDYQTGLANRRAFESEWLREWNRVQRKRQSLALFLIDIDHFKEVNDQHGHLAGDQCIEALGELLGNQFQRAGEVAARFGGEEFVVLLPDTNRDSAVTQAERLLDLVRELPIDLPIGRQLRVSVSVGVATIDFSTGAVASEEEAYRVSQSDSLKEMMAAADDALYQAKSSGRDCWIQINCACDERLGDDE